MGSWAWVTTAPHPPITSLPSTMRLKWTDRAPYSDVSPRPRLARAARHLSATGLDDATRQSIELACMMQKSQGPVAPRAAGERRRQTRRHDKAPAVWRGPSRDGGI
jgi:hypothetical protein